MIYQKNYNSMSEYLADRVFLGFPHVATAEGRTFYLSKYKNLEIEDSAVKSIIREKFDVVGQLNMAISEVMAVDDVTGWFRENTSIVKFNEFRYFEGLTEVPDHCFDLCSSLESVILPPNIKTIGEHAFSHNYKLNRLVLPESVETLSANAFSTCTGFTTVVVPKNVTYIGEYCWCHCRNLQRLVLTSEEPPTLRNATILSDCPNLSTIYVPSKSVEKYKKARNWSHFADKIRDARVVITWDFLNKTPQSLVGQGMQGVNVSGTIPSDYGDLSIRVLTAQNGTFIKYACSDKGYAQLVENTALRIPVFSVHDVVYIESYSGQYRYTIGGVRATKNQTRYYAKVSDVQRGYVEVVAVGTTYLYSITVSLDMLAAGDELRPVGGIVALWDWQNGYPSTIKREGVDGIDLSKDIHSSIEGTEMRVLSKVPGERIKLAYNSDGYAQVNQGTCIRVPVKSTNNLVSVISYTGQFRYTIGGIQAEKNQTTYRVTADDVRNGYVEIIATGTAYLYSISVEYELKE